MKTKPITRPMTKSLRKVAREAYALAREALPPYACPTSRQDYTQAQLFAALAVKTFLKTDYRGTVAILADFAELRQDLGLTKVPDHTTLWYAQQRLLKKGASASSSGRRSATPASAA
jgi:hypothetical protein